MTETIRYSHQEIKAQIKSQKELIQLAGVTSQKRQYHSSYQHIELQNQIIEITCQKSYHIAKNCLFKGERSELFSNV
jgi:hypothetical protein